VKGRARAIRIALVVVLAVAVVAAGLNLSAPARRPWATRPVAAGARLQKPLLVIVGGADTVVPPDEGFALCRAAPGPKRLLVVAGAGHGAAFAHEPARQEHTVLSFLKDLNRGVDR
jgi:pimeloyl-ACP methyl ester carboxylesterase